MDVEMSLANMYANAGDSVTFATPLLGFTAVAYTEPKAAVANTKDPVPSISKLKEATSAGTG